MDLHVALVTVCLCALAITSTEAGIPKCCVKTRTINRYMLLRVERSYEQLSTGACDIPALILYIKGSKKPICAPLKLKAILERIHGGRKRTI
ncbi:C-C motif chemokine 27b [Seriola aureovittata]|uniref:Chemokine interleukin-8-like domain-containing protein n=1 Tax=Seriola lalandi dorsalis TaxID=1841481 RepID=A0A3B4Y9A7_SERLL|nr:C-C motif chemokine 27b [Seriola aureovittata]